MPAPPKDNGLSIVASGTTGPSTTAIHYFGYGPMVNPIVRNRRNMHAIDAQAAILPEHRLTFAVGGIANLIVQRGYEVHGVLMKFTSEDDWKHFQTYDAGYNNLDTVHVFPYGTDPEEDTPITAYTMIMKDYDENKVESTIEQLPSERYLKLTGNGMRAYSLDDDYIEDQIMSVPYVPSRKPEDYHTFPLQTPDESSLPNITFDRYQRLCKRSKDIYFILNDVVLRTGPHDPEHPAALWIRKRMHGQHDSTLIIHQTIVEPDLPMVDKLEDLTPLHHGWAENHAVEYLRKCNIAAIKVYRIVSEEEFQQSRKRKGPIRRFLACLSGKKEYQRRASSPAGLGGATTLLTAPGSPTGTRTVMTAESSGAFRQDSRFYPGSNVPSSQFFSSELMQRGIRADVGSGEDVDVDDNSSICR